MGPAGEWPSHERANFGKKSVIENWLEIEVGLTTLGTNEPHARIACWLCVPKLRFCNIGDEDRRGLAVM
jgi:hypothetical protein